MDQARPDGRQAPEKTALSRRHFLKIGAIALAALAPAPALAGLSELIGEPVLGKDDDADRKLAFLNLHTGEKVDTVYWSQGDYLSDGLTQINYVLRDFRANEIKEIDRRLLDLLHRLHTQLETSEPFHLISGYRSPTTNAMLAAHSEGVARHSLHLEGKAADIRVPGRDLSTLHQSAVALQGGGVGFYPSSNFVHVDVGRVRYWGAADPKLKLASRRS